MTKLSYDDACKETKSLAEEVGLKVVSVSIEQDDDFGLLVPAINLMVEMNGNGKVEFEQMKKLETAFSYKYHDKCRTGLYYAAIGYDYIPRNQALIEIDCLPFDIVFEEKPTTSIAP